MIVKRADVVLGVKPCRFYCFLRIHAKIDHVEQELEHRLRLDVARTDSDVVFTADDLFGEIVCSVYDSERARRSAPDVVRFLWRARCPYGNDCARSVRYGDVRLQSDLRPAPLGPSQAGECYLCGVSGDRRRGDMLFSIGADGATADCPDSTRRQK